MTRQKKATRPDTADWNRGFYQAAADKETEGDILNMYVAVSDSFKAGYRAFFSMKAEVL